MHSLLANKAQPYETAQIRSSPPSRLDTERAAAGREHASQAKTRDEKLFYLDRVCELIRSTFYRQTQFAEFELAIHQAAERGEALSGKKMTAIYLDTETLSLARGMTSRSAVRR